jgi:hypothetical protein
VIKTKGGEFFAPSPANSPNRIDENNLQWAPGTISVHSGQGLKLNDPSNPRAGFKAYQAGPPGLSQEGDALVILPGGPHKTASAVVSAEPGTVLHYFCIVHPWMQGQIKVVK